MPLKVNKNIILECRKRCLSLTWYPVQVRERINRYHTYCRLLEHFLIELQEEDTVDDYVADPSVKNLLAIDYYHRAEYRKITVLLKCDEENAETNSESFIYYLALLQCSPVKVMASAYHQQLVPHQNSTSKTLYDGVFWNLLMAMYENRLGIHDRAVVSSISALSVCPFIFEAWNELGWAMSHLASAERRRSMEVLGDLFTLLQGKGYSDIASLLAMHLRGRWRINCAFAHEHGLSIDEVDPLYPFYLQLQGLCLCAHRDYEKARQLFEELLRKRPEHVDGMDVYSDILYLMEDSSQLALLNSRFAGRVDSATASAAIVCHIRGNYFCLKGDYANAAMMFHRAAQADAYHYAAWILAAQQYLELRSPEAAIDCFLRATGTGHINCTSPIDFNLCSVQREMLQIIVGGLDWDRFTSYWEIRKWHYCTTIRPYPISRNKSMARAFCCQSPIAILASAGWRELMTPWKKFFPFSCKVALT